jgi:hypothetical protein
VDSTLLVCSRWFSEEYDWFYIDSETQFYTFHVSLIANGDAGDSFNAPWDSKKSSNGMKFSSQDADHDLNPLNCAVTTGGGWWFNSCSDSKMLSQPFATSYTGYQWQGLAIVGAEGSVNGTLRASRMMIRNVT